MPVQKSRKTPSKRGMHRSHDHVAKQFVADDFDDRDVVLAIDSGHLSRLGNLARLSSDPAEAAGSLSLLRSYDPSAGDDLDVPDPYYDDAEGFENVLDQIERACAGLLAALSPRISAPADL